MIHTTGWFIFRCRHHASWNFLPATASRQLAACPSTPRPDLGPTRKLHHLSGLCKFNDPLLHRAHLRFRSVRICKMVEHPLVSLPRLQPFRRAVWHPRQTVAT